MDARDRATRTQTARRSIVLYCLRQALHGALLSSAGLCIVCQRKKQKLIPVIGCDVACRRASSNVLLFVVVVVIATSVLACDLLRPLLAQKLKNIAKKRYDVVANRDLKNFASKTI